MSTNKASTKWSSLISYPSYYINVPTGMDRSNYIVIDHNFFTGTINCIYKYDIDNDKWAKIDDVNIMENASWFSAALDVNKQILFLVFKNSVLQIQLNNKIIYKINKHNDPITAWNTKSIIIKNDLFVLNSTNKSILKWNSETKTFIKFSDMYNKMNLQHFAITYNNKNNSLLLFGGYDRDNYGRIDYILEWNKLHISLPKPMSSICCAPVINNKYILLFGGEEEGYQNSCDDIYIYSLKYKTIKLSKIKCPSKSTFECITVNNNVKEEKLVIGYVRKQWSICNVTNYDFLPYYLLKLIHSFYFNEHVYLLDRRDKKHYTMNTSDIV